MRQPVRRQHNVYRRIGQIVQSSAIVRNRPRAAGGGGRGRSPGIAVAVARCVSDEYAFDGAAACGQPLRFGGVPRGVDRIAEGGMGLILPCAGHAQRPASSRSRRCAHGARGRRGRRSVERSITLSQLPAPRDRTSAHLRRRGAVSPGWRWSCSTGGRWARRSSWYWPETSTGAGERREQTDELPTTPARGLRDRTAGPVRSTFPVAGAGRLLDAFSIITQICVSLDHVHRHGLVHRDVKPATFSSATTAARHCSTSASPAGGRSATRGSNEVGSGRWSTRRRSRSAAVPSIAARTSIRSAACSTSWSRAGCRFEAIRRARSPRARSARGGRAVGPERRRSGPARRSGDVDARQDACAPAGKRDGGGVALASIARRLSQRHVLSIDDAHHRFRQAG